MVVLSVNLINNGKTYIYGEKTSHNGVNYLLGFFRKGLVLLTLAPLIASYSTEILLIIVKL